MNYGLMAYRQLKLVGNANSYLTYRRSAKYLSQHRRKRGLVVEIGGGNGVMIRKLGPSLNASRLVSTDLAPSDATDVVCDGLALPLKDHSVDLVAAFEVLEHVPDPERMLKEVSRVLRRDGEFLMSVPFVYAQHDVVDFWRFTRRGLEVKLANAGLEVVEISSRGGTFLSMVQLAVELVHKTVVGDPASWRATSHRHRARSVTARILCLPLDALSWLATALDVVLDRSSRSPTGLVVAARPIRGAGDSRQM